MKLFVLIIIKTINFYRVKVENIFLYFWKTLLKRKKLALFCRSQTKNSNQVDLKMQKVLI